jgi:hypothetical protein
MLLAAVDDIITALGFDPMTDITNAVTMALDAAEAQLASILNTEFDQGTFVDTYYVQSPPYRQGPASQVEFRLHRGLVTSLTSVLVSPDPTQFGNSSHYTDVTANTNLEGDKGIVRDFKSQFAIQYIPEGLVSAIRTGYYRQWVQITYEAGFAADPNTTGSYLVSSIPDWLQQAAKLNALIGLADSPALTEAMVKLDVRTLQAQYQALLQRKMRYAPLAFIPL